jgi:hypothetical protein
MGSQQLLLIGLSVIVISLMVFAGYSIIHSYLESSNRDQVISGLYNLGVMAQAYYKKNDIAGGGGGDYIGWKIPIQLRNTSDGIYTATVQAARVNLRCNGIYTGRNGSSVVRVTARVDKNGIRITVVN